MHTSRGTSLSANHPRLFGPRSPLWQGLMPGMRVFDLGAGSTNWPRLVCESRGLEYWRLDPFHCPEKENAITAARAISRNFFDRVVVSNVLNVVESRAHQLNIVRQAAIGLKKDGVALFSAYASPREGEAPTRPDNWQRGELIQSYEHVIWEGFDKVVVDTHEKIIIATKPKPVLNCEVVWWLVPGDFES